MNAKSKTIFAIFLGAFALAGTPLQAVTTIDFDGFPGPFSTFIAGTEDGFDLSSDGNGAIFENVLFGIPGPGNIFGPETPSSLAPTLTITKSGGGLFQLISLDIGTWDLSSPTPHPITGYVGAAVVGSDTAISTFFIGSPLPTFTPTILAGVNIDRLTIHLIPGDEFQALDNIVLGDATSVPDTGSTALLLGAGLFGLAAIRRKLS